MPYFNREFFSDPHLAWRLHLSDAQIIEVPGLPPELECREIAWNAYLPGSHWLLTRGPDGEVLIVSGFFPDTSLAWIAEQMSRSGDMF